MTHTRHLRDWAATFASLAAAMAEESAARRFDALADLCRESAARLDKIAQNDRRPPAQA
jgi:hypothetical protein